MPNLKQHCAISKKRTGFDFMDLHKWIDEPAKDLGYDHRTKRHAYNVQEEKFIENYWERKKGKGWGQKAVVEWLFHIALDNLSTAFKKSYKVYKGNTYNYMAFGLSKSQYIYNDYETLSESKLKEEFEGFDQPLIDSFIDRITGFFKKL